MQDLVEDAVSHVDSDAPSLDLGAGDPRFRVTSGYDPQRSVSGNAECVEAACFRVAFFFVVVVGTLCAVVEVQLRDEDGQRVVFSGNSAYTIYFSKETQLRVDEHDSFRGIYVAVRTALEAKRDVHGRVSLYIVVLE